METSFQVTGSSVKYIIKSLLPNFILLPIQRYRQHKWEELHPSVNKDQYYNGLSTGEVFTKIYEVGAWGKSNESTQGFFSGSGSHANNLVSPYIEALQKTLSSFPQKPNVVDLGCGDFYVGSKIRYLFDSYIACDIVESLIDFNKQKYKDLDVDFRVLDLTKDELPNADIVLIRQVLQHLSNKEISAVIPQISSKYNYLVLTEHLPKDGSFVHNLDKPAGPSIRPFFNSGIILTSPPFNLQVKETTCICEAEEYPGIIRTNLYKLT